MDKTPNFNPTVTYASFAPRLGAYLLDILIIGVPSFLLQLLNFSTVRSFYVNLVLAMVGLLYKPFMESRYQATLGKMALNLKVTDLNFQPISFEKSLLRSLIYLLPALLAIPLQYLAFNNPALVNLEDYWAFSQATTLTYPMASIFNCFFSLFVLTDVIMLLVDETRYRSLKDRLAKTCVIKTS